MANKFLQFSPPTVYRMGQTDYENNVQRLGGIGNKAVASSRLFNKALYQVSTMVSALAAAMDSKGYDMGTSVEASVTTLTNQLKNIMTLADLATYSTSVLMRAEILKALTTVTTTNIVNYLGPYASQDWVNARITESIPTGSGVTAQEVTAIVNGILSNPAYATQAWVNTTAIPAFIDKQSISNPLSQDKVPSDAAVVKYVNENAVTVANMNIALGLKVDKASVETGVTLSGSTGKLPDSAVVKAADTAAAATTLADAKTYANGTPGATWMKLPGGLILEWGNVSGTNAYLSATTEVTFTKIASVVFATAIVTGSADTNSDYSYQLFTKSANKATFRRQEFNTTNIGTHLGFDWFAIGY